MKNLKLFSWIGLLVAVVVLSFLLNSQCSEKKRLSDNQRALLSDIKQYQTKDSMNVASVEKLTFSNREFRQSNEELMNTISDLNLKLNRLQSASQQVTKTTTQIKTVVKDRFIQLDGRVDTLRCIDFRDPWLTVSGCIQNNQFDGLIESSDTIEQFVHRVPHHIWFIKYGTKAIRQEVLSKNPHTKIIFSKYIELKK